ncbi:hypothetical protein LINGRAHAP2_LOCUS2456 [Linum grandiflorum]
MWDGITPGLKSNTKAFPTFVSDVGWRDMSQRIACNSRLRRKLQQRLIYKEKLTAQLKLTSHNQNV